MQDAIWDRGRGGLSRSRRIVEVEVELSLEVEWLRTKAFVVFLGQARKAPCSGNLNLPVFTPTTRTFNPGEVLSCRLSRSSGVCRSCKKHDAKDETRQWAKMQKWRGKEKASSQFEECPTVVG